ncbi:hypothetical protein, partial [Zoogloea sp.]|uniref:hypothetical protein n=1 Tax=Zoogloea sp. TaxID=49181 RepID=UPI002B9D5479
GHFEQLADVERLELRELHGWQRWGMGERERWGMSYSGFATACTAAEVLGLYNDTGGLGSIAPEVPF